MADLPPSYGLDPSVVSYLQGGDVPSGTQPQQITAMPDPGPTYGLPPSVVAGVQNGFAPPPPPAAAQQQQQPTTGATPPSVLPQSVVARV